jgi:aspartyl-tRNA(Asn)/glutamyl-tRNA(Gln) amidotransferase subunit C
MSLTANQIETIAGLAKLALRPEEIPAYVDSLGRILGLVGELESADTGALEPMAHPLTGQQQRLRADVIASANERELFQRNAPQVEAGLYLVPRVIE